MSTRKISLGLSICAIPFALLCLGLTTKVYGQLSGPIQTDRPDQTESPYLVPPGHLQFEMGCNYAHESHSTASLQMPTSLWKYGINDRVECRAIAEINALIGTSGSQTGLLPMQLGFKATLWNAKAWLPEAAFIAHVALPQWASRDLTSPFIAPNFRFTFQHVISQRLSIGYNLGAQWDGESPEPTCIYTLATGYAISQKWSCYAEIYGFVPQYTGSTHRADGGVAFQPSPHRQFDLSGGMALIPTLPFYFFSLGYSHRFAL
ncbi:MAG: transporter [Bacteroidetes bacterium]|nr:transporter [Bacteroidota bacterium]